MREKCLRQLLFAGTDFLRIAEKSQKLEPAKISCNTGMSYANKSGNDVNLTTDQLSLQSY